MAGVSEEAFAQAAQQAGLLSYDELEAAKAVQAESAKKGVLLDLPDILIKQGIITSAIREKIEIKARSAQTGGVKQLGNYKLLKKLGEGGMGAVYLAEDALAGRQVAVKVLPPNYAKDSEFLSRFRREAKSAGKLNHPNIVSAYAVGEEGGHHYYSMEYCPGEPLGTRLKREQHLPWNTAVEIIAQVTRGLQYAHEHGIIHRDIKPDNIFLAGDSPGGPVTAKILDLGLSKDIGSSDQSFNTQSGVAMGTPHYISPEQAQGLKNIDGRTDIYSLGATLYHLLTGQTPYQGTSAGLIIAKHLTEQIPNPQDIRNDIPDSVVQIIMKMMAKEPADRYADCKELLADLELVLEGKEPSSPALDVGKSSIAMRGAVKPVRAKVDDQEKGRQSTGKREPVKAGRQSTRTEQKSPVMLYAGIGGGVGILLLVIALVISRGKSTPVETVKNDPAKVPMVEKQSEVANPPAVVNPPSTPANTGKVDDAWVKSVQAFAPEKQVEAVTAKLVELNPGFDAEVKPTIEDNKVTRLMIVRRNKTVTNISPVAALKDLKSLKLNYLRGVDDLSALKGLALTDLAVFGTPISDLSPLRGMPLSGEFACFDTNVADLSPLKGMPLQRLLIGKTPVSDISPLAGMKLLFLACDSTNVTDLSPLREMPLKDLHCDFVAARDTAILKSITTLQKINMLPVAEFWAKNGGTAPTAQKGVLLTEDFENLDLDRLPANFSVKPQERNLISIVPQPGHGKVLRISRKAGDNPDAGLLITLDPTIVRGHTIRASIKAYCPLGYAPNATLNWAGPRIAVVVGANSAWAKTLLSPQQSNWRTDWVAPKAIPENAQNVAVVFGVQRVDAEVFFDDLVIEIDPDPNSAPPSVAARQAVNDSADWKDAIDLLALIDPLKDPIGGTWSRTANGIESDFAFPAHLEIPYRPSEEYVFFESSSRGWVLRARARAVGGTRRSFFPSRDPAQYG